MRNFSMRAVSRVLFFLSANFLTALTLIAGPISAQASSLPVASVSCGAAVTITFPDITSGVNPQCPGGTVVPQTVLQPIVAIPGIVYAGAGAQVLNGAPGVTASVGVTLPGPTSAALTASGSASLSYYMSVAFSTGIAGQGGIPLTVGGYVGGSIVTTCSLSNCTGVVTLGQAEVYDLNTFSDDLLIRINSTGGTVPISPSGLGFFHTLTVGDVYEVTLTAQALNGTCPTNGIACTATVGVDPTFFIDPSNPLASDYTLNFSPGIINGGDTLPTTSTTPLPATLPLFATGFAGLGLLGWRRKRTAQAAT